MGVQCVCAGEVVTVGPCCHHVLQLSMLPSLMDSPLEQQQTEGDEAQNQLSCQRSRACQQAALLPAVH